MFKLSVQKLHVTLKRTTKQMEHSGMVSALSYISVPTGHLLCVSNVVVHSTSCTVVSLGWEEPAHGLSYRISVCRTPKRTWDCPYHHTCSECSSYKVTGLLPNQNYTIMVDTLVSLNGEGCSSQGCTSNTVTAATEILCEFSAQSMQH